MAVDGMLTQNPLSIDDDPPSRDGLDLRTLGVSGLQRTGGVVQDEPLRELQGDRWRKICRQMQDNDPVIGAFCYAIEMLLRRAEWRIVPGVEDDDSAEEAAEFIRQCLFEDMSYSWPDILSEVVTFIPWGWAYLELVYKIRGGDTADDPSRRSKFTDGKVGWRKWALRSQDTLLLWQFDSDGGIRAMVQQAPPDYLVRIIPIEKALLFRTTARKGNPEGRSVLRPAYRPWYMKTRIENLEGVGVERDLAGIPVIKCPMELFSATASDQYRALFADLKRIVTNLRNDEQAGVLLPSDRDEKGNAYYELELLSTGGTRQFNTTEIVNRYNAAIAMTVMADFLLLGHANVGSFALASSKTNLFATALGAFADAICGIVNQYAIPRLLKLNGMDLEQPPQLDHGDIETVDLGELGDFVVKLSQAGASLFPDDALENKLRTSAGLPERPPPTEEELGLLESEPVMEETPVPEEEIIEPPPGAPNESQNQQANPVRPGS